MNRRLFIATIIAGLVLAAPAARAMNVTLYNPATAGVSEFSWSYHYDTQLQLEVIDIYEVWSDNDASFLHIEGFNLESNAWVRKHVRNDTGLDWHSFNHELLDPDGQFEDYLDDPVTMPVPDGFSNSNDVDGLSFAQRQDLPRTSTKYAGYTVDEEEGKDFMEFVDGTIAGTGTVADRSDVMTFGLRDNGNPHDAWGNQGFLLRQIANEGIILDNPDPPVVPEPATLLLLGGGLLGGAAVRRIRRRAGRLS